MHSLDNRLKPHQVVHGWLRRQVVCVAQVRGLPDRDICREAECHVHSLLPREIEHVTMIALLLLSQRRAIVGCKHLALFSSESAFCVSGVRELRGLGEIQDRVLILDPQAARIAELLTVGQKITCAMTSEQHDPCARRRPARCVWKLEDSYLLSRRSCNKRFVDKSCGPHRQSLRHTAMVST